MPVKLPDWGVPTEGAYFGGRETSGLPVPADKDDPQHAEPAEESSAQVAEGEDDDSSRYRKLLADGLMTPDQLRRAYGLAPEEVEAVSNAKVPSRATIEEELAAIRQRMRDDRAGYFKDSKAQARHLELIEQPQDSKAQPAVARRSEQSDQADTSRAAIDKELADIAKLRRENSRAYFKDERIQARERELITARDDADEVARQTEQVQTTVAAILDAVPDAESFEADFDAVFRDLPEQAQTAIRHEFRLQAESPARPASDADLKRFASTEEGAACVREWGKDAGRKVATVRHRLDRMLLSGGDMEAAVDWFEGLPASQAKAVLRALAG